LTEIGPAGHINTASGTVRGPKAWR